MRRTILLLLGLAAVALASPAAALGAGSVTAEGSAVQYLGDGTNNIVTVSYASGTFTIGETGIGVLANSGCTDNGNTVTCVANKPFSAQMGEGNDTITISSLLPSTAEINGDGGIDTVNGGPGPEEIDGGLGNDILFGNDGTDDIVGDGPVPTGGNDMMDGGPGNDTFEAAPPVGSDNPVSGGQDTIIGGSGDDTLGPPTFGYPPDPDGPDDFTGGSGRDTVDYSRRIDSEDGTALPVTVTEDGVANDGAAGELDNIRGDVEVILGTGKGDTMVGSAVNNQFVGGGGDDTLAGGGGNDLLDGGASDAGSDTLDGGAGNDVGTGGPGDDSLLGGAGLDNLDGGGGTDTLDGGDDTDLLTGGAGIDALRGGAGNDQLRGGAAALVGADGGDSLKGDAGNDSLLGDDGDDTLDGGTGADVLGGGNGTDTADYQFRLEDITVTLDGKANDGTPGEGDNVGSDVENVRGGGFNDTITGDPQSNLIEGGDGVDYADGGNRTDQLSGGDAGDVVRSRDGVADNVVCGRGTDFVVADSQDRVQGDCDRVDSSGKSRPKLGRTASVRPRKGVVDMSPTRITRFVPLRDLVNLPVASEIDASNGEVTLQSAKTKGRPQTATLTGGMFQVLQSRRRSARGLTDLVLKGGSFRNCSTASAAYRRAGAAQRRRLRKRVVRRLRSNARGRFRTRGRYSAATVRGTRYEVIDRCDGTLTKVRSGRVAVRDVRRKKTVIVRAGKSYLARAR